MPPGGCRGARPPGAGGRKHRLTAPAPEARVLTRTTKPARVGRLRCRSSSRWAAISPVGATPPRRTGTAARSPRHRRTSAAASDVSPAVPSLRMPCGCGRPGARCRLLRRVTRSGPGSDVPVDRMRLAHPRLRRLAWAPPAPDAVSSVSSWTGRHPQAARSLPSAVRHAGSPSSAQHRRASAPSPSPRPARNRTPPPRWSPCHVPVHRECCGASERLRSSPRWSPSSPRVPRNPRRWPTVPPPGPGRQASPRQPR